MARKILQVADSANPSIPRLMLDIRRAGRESPLEAAARRRSRLELLIGYARSRSPFYRGLYAGLPREIPDIRLLPPVSKRELSGNFDAWATDRSIRRETAEAFVSDPSTMGRLYLDRFVAFSTSGTTGTPVVLLQDRKAISVYQALLLARRVPSLVFYD